jgi:iron complex transport system ATP-binding protein
VAEVLRMESATVLRAGRPILDAVDWVVNADERWVVLGPNGAGKTTLLQLAAASLHPTSGNVTVLGERLGAVDVFELRPRIGLASAALAERIPQDESVRDVVVTAAWAVTGRWREDYAPEDLERAEGLLELMGVDHLSQRVYGTLSEGERKRVQVARALMTDPELLLLDEPAAGLDLGGREELVSRLAEIASDPWAPAQVLVTHHVEEIPAGTTHVLLMREGRVVAKGPIAETLRSRMLSDTFGLALRVGHLRTRWWARAAWYPTRAEHSAAPMPEATETATAPAPSVATTGPAHAAEAPSREAQSYSHGSPESLIAPEVTSVNRTEPESRVDGEHWGWPPG